MPSEWKRGGCASWGSVDVLSPLSRKKILARKVPKGDVEMKEAKA
jgi:hypothetical protein